MQILLFDFWMLWLSPREVKEFHFLPVMSETNRLSFTPVLWKARPLNFSISSVYCLFVTKAFILLIVFSGEMLLCLCAVELMNKFLCPLQTRPPPPTFSPPPPPSNGTPSESVYSEIEHRPYLDVLPEDEDRTVRERERDTHRCTLWNLVDSFSVDLNNGML